MPTMFVVAGPNGCGKSTLTRTTRFAGSEVIDPDAIASRLSPGAPERATRSAEREAVRRRRALIRTGRTFVVESTIAGHGTLRLMETAREAGYRVELHYVAVGTPEQALVRIRNRVALGGHDVPEPDVRRRFDRSLAHLPAAIARSDEIWLYDNASLDHPYSVVAILSGGAKWIAESSPDWATAALGSVT